MQLKSLRRQLGVSLIEVLVSIFIVSMGILALAGLLSASSRLGKASELRASATLLANDLADRMRANPGGVAALSYDYKPPSYSATPTKPADPGVVCTVTTAPPCTPDNIAKIDLYEWRLRLFYSLPAGDGYVVYTPAAPGGAGAHVDVWVAWTDNISANNQESQANGGTVRECPASFKSTAKDGKPRCLYLQVGL